MRRFLFRLLVWGWILAGPAVAPVIAQQPINQLRAELISSWVVTVEGEPRLRTLKILSLGEKATDVFLLEATYGFLDGRQDPAAAELTQSPAGRKLLLTSSAHSVITATQSADGSFSGTFKSAIGVEKPVKVERISEQDLQAKVSAAIAFNATRVFADEDKDWGVAPTSSLRRSNYHAPTPLTVPGAKVIRTMALKSLLDTDKTVVVVDVLDGTSRVSVPGAHLMQGAGVGLVFGSDKSRFSTALDKLTGNDRGRPLVFLCLSSQCWLSYNASLQALDAGYKNVTWFRGGVEAWRAAGLPMRPPESIAW